MMQSLVELVKSLSCAGGHAAFSVYSSIKEQRILNVPVVKPLLICILNGQKILGAQDEINCAAGTFVFLSNRPTLDMRNVPAGDEYLALLIEFDIEDFAALAARVGKRDAFIRGPMDELFAATITQFIEWTRVAPPVLWPARRQEILHLLMHMGFHDIGKLADAQSVAARASQILANNINVEVTAPMVASALAMSEATLRRKLLAEGTSFQVLKDKVRLGYGLHLLQTTPDSVACVAERCGYQSQSRFTSKFRQLFGITPTALRKTRLSD